MCFIIYDRVSHSVLQGRMERKGEGEKGEGRGGSATKRGLERHPGTHLEQRARPTLKCTNLGDVGWEVVGLA